MSGPTDIDDAAVLEGAEKIATAFARVLRGLGLSVPVGCVLTFWRATA